MPDPAELPNLTKVLAAFRLLADEHAEARRALESRRAWQRLERRSLERPVRGGTSRWTVGVAAALVVAAIVPIIVVAGSDEGLSYELSGASADHGVIRTEQSSALVSFSDRSRIQVAPKSELAVDVVGPHATLTRVNRGSLEVAIEHRADSDWRFFAGPYEVRVTGTSFRLAWEPKNEFFSVEMRQGRVRVLGPEGLDRALAAGEVLDLSRKPTVAPPSVAPPPEPAVSESSAPMPEAGKARAASVSAVSRSAPATLGWPALVASGHFGEVIEAANAAGLDGVLGDHSALDLKALAEAAHYSGKPALALRAWSSLRQRFPSHAAARQSAFHLGRIHDQQGHRAEALSWLSTYLREAPADVYAAEALGRRLILIDKLEGTAAARAAARHYRERYPNGAYSRTARAILGEH